MAPLIPVNPFDLIIFGGNGDLALRKLLPSLYQLHCDSQFSENSRVIAVGRNGQTRSSYIDSVRQALSKDLESIDENEFEKFSSRLQYLHFDVSEYANWDELIEILSGHDDKIRVFYLAMPPTLFGPVATGLKLNSLITQDSRIALEKPIGESYGSAKAINDEVGASFLETQIFRVDHYLGKETVQNLLALRFGNSLFEPLWRREVIDHVQITVAEVLGVDNRIEFYDEIGALRDMVQNHLLQLVCLIAMEPPSNLNDDAVRDEKLKVLRALKPITEKQVTSSTVRAQYNSGAIDGSIVPSYASQLSSDSATETFVALKLEIDNWRWSGVPFYMRTGKRLASKHTEIVIQFKQVPHSIFTSDNSGSTPNQLSIMLQPDEGVKLSIQAKEPGPGGFDLKPVSLDLSFEDTFGLRFPDAYERLLIEILRGNPAMFMRRDEIETAWQWIDQIIA
ncbi:MAG: glucose-6-phosphate dehydrogenase, partial [Gammaproteobacteria bacterium]|nr:glucose-6-phosphate dehydrogenase [Gammaproteobacteria bacterium]